MAEIGPHADDGEIPARTVKGRNTVILPLYYGAFENLPKTGAKKAADLLRIYCFMCRCGASGYSVFMVVQCDKTGLYLLKLNNRKRSI